MSLSIYHNAASRPSWPPILTKPNGLALWRQGYFGPTWPTWQTYKELVQSGFRGRVAIRYVSSTGNGPCVYDIPFADAKERLDQLVAEGWDRDRCYFNSSENPDSALVLQGEWYNGPYQDDGVTRHDYLLYSCYKAKMRIALQKEPQNAYGLRSTMLLRAVMTPSSWEDFQVLRERHPHHVFELTVWDSRILGAGRNTMIWEVRYY